jgi:hypothetical protein
VHAVHVFLRIGRGPGSSHASEAVDVVSRPALLMVSHLHMKYMQWSRPKVWTAKQRGQTSDEKREGRSGEGWAAQTRAPSLHNFGRQQRTETRALSAAEGREGLRILWLRWFPGPSDVFWRAGARGGCGRPEGECLGARKRSRSSRQPLHQSSRVLSGVQYVCHDGCWQLGLLVRPVCRHCIHSIIHSCIVWVPRNSRLSGGRELETINMTIYSGSSTEEAEASTARGAQSSSRVGRPCLFTSQELP